MRRFLFSVVLIIGSFVLQTTLFQALSFGGIVPNLMIVLTASYGFMRGKKAGLLTGFFSGLLCDIFFGPVIGLNALIYMYIGFLSGYAHRICYDDDIKVPVMLAGIGDLLYGLSVYAQGTSGARNLFIPDYFTGDFLYSDPYTDCLPGISLY